MGTEDTGQTHRTCINRNILECKVFSTIPDIHSSPVLIETYWNVKTFSTSGFWMIPFVLIETYWNVKNFARMISLESMTY